MKLKLTLYIYEWDNERPTYIYDRFRVQQANNGCLTVDTLMDALSSRHANGDGKSKQVDSK